MDTGFRPVGGGERGKGRVQVMESAPLAGLSLHPSGPFPTREPSPVT